MDITVYVAKALQLLFTVGLNCTSPNFDIKDHEIFLGPARCEAAGPHCALLLGAYFPYDPAGSENDGTRKNVIWLNQPALDRQGPNAWQHVILHELAHCGRYEAREKAGTPHPSGLDPREETETEVLTRRLLAPQ